MKNLIKETRALRLLPKWHVFTILALFFATINTNILLASAYEKTPPKVTSSIDCLPPPTSFAAIQPIKSGLWNDQSIWPGNKLPSNNDDITIPNGRKVTMVGTCRARNIYVEGVLDAVKDQAGGAWIDLEAQRIVVRNGGLFEIGTEDQPYIADKGPTGARCQITLTGGTNRNLAKQDASYKGILVQNGGRLELHGKKKMSWTNLAATANVGANQITLVEAVNWEVGDQIALTATTLVNKHNVGWTHTDEAEIVAISGDGKTITLKNGLKYKHIGGSKSYTRARDGKTWNAAIRGEVGLLSHYIKIQGRTNTADGFGGHVMIMKGATSHSENIELYNMGQKAVLGRYPYHWHLNEDKSKGSYLKNSSVHKSFNRAVTIHGTDYVTVDGVFAYDHIGHGIFLEDGGERFNTIKNNVVFSTRRPSDADRLTPSDNQFRQAQNQTPSSYWITNPNNYFENNVAAGTDGTGFWLAFPKGKPLFDTGNLPYFKDVNPQSEPLGKFDGFVAHNCKNGWDIFDGLNADHSIAVNTGWKVNTNQYFRNGIFYGNHQAIYSGIGGGAISAEKFVVFQDCVFTDNIIVTMLASDITLENCLFNADTGLGVFTGTRNFYRFYDGPGRHINCHFETWNLPNARMISEDGDGGATENFNPTYIGITKGFPEPFSFRYNDENPGKDRARKMGHFFKDLDGSLTGKPGTIIRDIPFLRDGHEYRHSSWYKAARSDYSFAGLWIRQINGNTDISVSRTKPGTETACFIDKGNKQDGGTYKFPLIVNEDFMYTFHFGNTPGSNVHMIWDYGEAGDLVLVRLKNFGKFTNFRIDGAGFTFPKVNSRAAVEAATDFAYYVEPNGDVYAKLRDIGGTARREFFLRWNNNGSYQPPALPCTNNDFTPGVSTNNDPPSVSFQSPVENQFDEGVSLGVVVNASDSDGSVADVKLYLNNTLVRQEGVAPYEWGTASPGQNDTALYNLAEGTYELKAVATDNAGKTTTITKIITVTKGTLSVVEIDDQKSIELFPNPVKSTLFITGPTEGKLMKVYDLLGALKISTSLAKNGSEIDFSQFSKGVYMVRIIDQDNSGGNQLIYKIVKTD